VRNACGNSNAHCLVSEPGYGNWLFGVRLILHGGCYDTG
jgi:hypothetical protein